MYIIVVGAGKVGWNLARELLDHPGSVLGRGGGRGDGQECEAEQANTAHQGRRTR